MTLTVPPAVRSPHARLLKRIDSYVQFIESGFERRPVLLKARIDGNAFDVFQECVAVQRELTGKGVSTDIGCTQPNLAVVSECASQDVATIPGGKFAIDNQTAARAEAERLAGSALPWPRDTPAWVARYDVSAIGLYSPHFVDGDPQFVDALKDRRAGVMVSFGDEFMLRVVRVRYSPVPECDTNPVYFATPEDVAVTYTFESNIDDRDGQKYDIALGEFSLPTTFVHMDLVYAHPDVPSETARGTEFVAWAKSMIAAALSR